MIKKLTEEQRKVWSHLNGEKYIPPHIRELYKHRKKLRSMPWVGKPWPEALKILTKKPTYSSKNKPPYNPKSGKFA